MTPFGAIYFDCDSTLSTIEGIDDLAGGCPPEVRDQIAALTDAAMDGDKSVEQVYGERLALIRPTRAAVEAIGQAYIDNPVPDVTDVVAALRWLGKQVGIVSGGLQLAVDVFARHLDVEPSRVHAVGLEFDSAGNYQDFDRTCPLARNGGKPEVLRNVAAEPPLAFVGDGITDLESAPVVSRFIGFGGVARREKVVDASEHYADGPSLASVLPFCTTPAEQGRLRTHSRFAHLLEGPTS